MFKKLISHLQRVGQCRVQQHLLGMPDSFLQEHGFCREALTKGPDAWPWLTDTSADQIDSAPKNPAISAMPTAIAKPIKPVKSATPQESPDQLDRVA